MTNQLKQTYYFVLLACVFALGIYLQGAGTIDDFLYYQEDIVYLTVQHIELVLQIGRAHV